MGEGCSPELKLIRETQALSLRDLQCERFKSASSKAGAESNLVLSFPRLFGALLSEVRAQHMFF